MKRLARCIVLAILLAPLAALICKTQRWNPLDPNELMYALRQTFFQSALSTLGSLGLGILGCLGLIGAKKHRFIVEMCLLIPNFVPPLFVIIAALQVFSPFPFGLIGVSMTHMFLFSGLVAVICAHLFETKLGALAEVSWVQGVSRKNFLLKVALPFLRRDLLLVGLYVFTMCTASFSVPMILGGRGISTIEILIYEKLMIDYDIGNAIILCIMQFFLLVTLSKISKSESSRFDMQKNLSHVSVPFAHAPLLLVTASILLVNLFGFAKGVKQVLHMSDMQHYLSQALLGSIVTVVFVSIFVFITLYLMAIGWPNKKFETLLEAFSSPSSTVIGIGIITLFPLAANQGLPSQAFKLAFGFLVLVMGSLYRLKWSSSLEQLRFQLAIAQTQGASSLLTFKKIIFPQLLPDALFLTGLSGFWVSGDFALSRLITGQDITLALIAKSLMSSYRLESATVITWMALIFGLSVFLIFWRLSHVVRQKLVS